jgi:hypothetical protein
MLGPTLMGVGLAIVAGSLLLNFKRRDFGKRFDLVGLLWLAPIGLGAGLMITGAITWGFA